MNADRLLAHYERIADTPDAVTLSRRFILDLAVRGKLVPQEPNDEPAPDLFRRISDAKTQYFSARNGGRTKNQRISAATLSYDIPTAWIATRLGDVYDVRDGTHNTPKYVDVGYPLITSKNLSSGYLSFEDVKLISEHDHLQISERSHVERGDILLAMIGSIGNPVIVNTDRPFSIKNVALFKYFDKGLACPGFLRIALQHAADEMRELAAGGLQPFVSLGFLRSYPVTLPPLAEQNRIVAKTNELMTLCDNLETARAERETKRDRFTAATFARLNASSPDPTIFADHAQLAIKSFRICTARPDQIKQLRQTILKLAVRGKLVLQDIKDEPALKLLQRIAREQQRPTRPAKKNSVDFDSALGTDPFLIPGNWAWTRLGAIGDWGSGSTPPRDRLDFYGGEITWLKSGELNDNQMLAGSREAITALALESGSFRKNRSGDVLMAMYGATIGKVAILAENAVTNQAVCGCTPFGGLFNRFLFLFLLSHREQFHSASEGGAQPNISKVKILRTPFPLPPLAEQYRIVTKVDELMALCDRLEAGLAVSDSIRHRVLDALIAEALVPADREPELALVGLS